MKTTTISAGTGLAGGGSLAANRTISLSDASIASLGYADTVYGYFTNGLLQASHVGDLSGTYLPLTGGTLSGNLTINHAASSGAMLVYKNGRANSSSGGWNDHVISITDSSGTELGRLGIYGAGAALNYLHLGLNAYSGDNLRVYADRVQFGSSTIYHSGNSNLTTVDWRARNLFLPNGSSIYLADNPSEGSATNRAVLTFATGNVLRIGYGIRTTEYHTQIYGGNRIRFATAISGAVADRFLMLGNDFYPNTTEVSDLGVASRYWNNAYIKTIYENGTSLANKYHPKGGDSSLNFVAAAIEATSFKLASGAPTITWDATNSAWHLSGNFYTDGWMSAGGVSNGGGTSGIDEAAMWAALQRNSGEGENKQIHNKHLPTCGTGLSYTINNDGIATAINVAFPVTSVAGKTGAITLAVADITDFPTTWSWVNITGAPSKMPNPAALTFGTKTYDGSAAKTILASDLGALTSHQTVTLASGTNNYTMKLTTAAGATDNIPVTGVAAAVDTLQAQIDSVSSRDMFDELYATSLFSDTAAFSTLYAASIALNGSDLATTLETFLTSVPVATSSAYGGIKIGYTESRENYAVQLSSGKAYVHVADSIPYSDAIGDVKTSIKGLDESLTSLSMNVDSINALLSSPTIEAIEFKLVGGSPVMTWDDTNQA